GWPGALVVKAPQAREYYGLKFARQALDLDPEYRPAQQVFLGLAIDAVQEKSPGVPLSKSSPKVAELLAKATTDLVLDILQKALKDKNPRLAVAAIDSLGDRAAKAAKKPTAQGQPALVKALYDDDPRVALAAARALLKIPGKPAPKTSLRIV